MEYRGLDGEQARRASSESRKSEAYMVRKCSRRGIIAIRSELSLVTDAISQEVTCSSGYQKLLSDL